MSAMIANIIVTAILILIVSGACYYMYKEKKKGNHCIGCPMAANCPRKTVGCQENYKK